MAIGLTVRVVLAAELPIMFDEAWSIKQAADVPAEMFLGREFDGPPLSYLLFAAWGLVSSRLGWLRLLSIALSLASIYPGAVLARKLFGERAVRPTVWILALWPLPLYAGWNIRYYAPLLLLSALYLVCWAPPLAGQGVLPERAVAVSVLEVLLFHTAYTSLPLVATLNGYAVCRLLASREWRALARWLGRGFVVVLVCTPQYFVYRRNAEAFTRIIESYPSLGLVPDLVVAVKAVILSELPYWHDVALRPLWFLPVLIVVLTGVGLWRGGRASVGPLAVMSVTILLVALGIGSGLRRLGQYYFQVLPLVAVVAGAGLAELPRPIRVATIGLVASVSLLRLVDPSYHYAFGDTRAVARLVDRVDAATPVVYLENALRAFTDATQYSRPRVIGILTAEAASEPTTSERRAQRWWSDPVVYDRPLVFQPATGVYAERWSQERWANTMASGAGREVYLVVPVEARGTAPFRAEAVERGRRAAQGVMAAANGAWEVSEAQFPGTLVFHLRRP